MGRGAFAVVRRCIEKKTGLEWASKIIDLRPIKMKGASDMRFDRVMREVTILKSVAHPNIVKLHTVYENTNTLVIVMEKANITTAKARRDTPMRAESLGQTPS